MTDQPSVSRRDFLSTAGKAIMFAAIVPLVGCGGPSGNNDNKENGGKSNTSDSNSTGSTGTKMPEGVTHDPSNVKHTPQCTVSKDGSTLKIAVLVAHVVHTDHHIFSVKLFAPGPAFTEVAAHTLTAEQLATIDEDKFEHTVSIETSKLPAGADHLVAVSYCNIHGDYGSSAAC